MGEQLQRWLRITLDEFAPGQVGPLDHVFRAVHSAIFSLISPGGNQRGAGEPAVDCIGLTPYRSAEPVSR